MNVRATYTNTIERQRVLILWLTTLGKMHLGTINSLCIRTLPG